ncbi:MAG TPA: hypothetical protein VN908_05835 [Gemmatimonadales bacterium]|nr:hypothetical protein [Gemmatimonadales bacterium]
MIRRSALLTGLAIVALLPGACRDSRADPLGVNSPGSPAFDRAREGNDDEGDFLRLVSVVGPGEGRFRATRVPHPTVPGNFAVHVEARIHHAKPNTTYLVQRAAEAFIPSPPAGFPMSTTTDGSCQRGLAIAPWSTLVPVPPAFVTWPTTLTTDDEGNGATDFVFATTAPLPLFDVMFRVIESGSAPQSALLTDCTVLPLL